MAGAYRQGQLANHHVLFQMIFGTLLLAPRSPIASGKFETAALFPEVSWS